MLNCSFTTLFLCLVLVLAECSHSSQEAFSLSFSLCVVFSLAVCICTIHQNVKLMLNGSGINKFVLEGDDTALKDY